MPAAFNRNTRGTGHGDPKGMALGGPPKQAGAGQNLQTRLFVMLEFAAQGQQPAAVRKGNFILNKGTGQGVGPALPGEGDGLGVGPHAGPQRDRKSVV